MKRTKTIQRPLRDKCILIAFNHENLFPNRCIEIISEVYGYRINRMVPETLTNLVYSMMLQVTDCVEVKECRDAVNEWLNDF